MPVSIIYLWVRDGSICASERYSDVPDGVLVWELVTRAYERADGTPDIVSFKLLSEKES